jgi:hypothetical protein
MTSEEIQQEVQPSPRLYVGNLSFSTNVEALTKAFTGFKVYAAFPT